MGCGTVRPMDTPTPYRLVGFFAVLATVFGAAVAVGSVVGPEPRPSAADAPHAMAGAGDMAEHHPVRGLAVADDGLRLVTDSTAVERGRATVVVFRVVD